MTRAVPAVLLLALGSFGCSHEQEMFAATFLGPGEGAAGKYGMMCKAYQRGVGLDAFQEAIAHNAYLGSIRRVSHLAHEGDLTLAVDGVLTTATGSYDVRVFEGVEDGRMCISGLSIGGTPMLPSPAETPSGRPLAPPATPIAFP